MTTHEASKLLGVAPRQVRNYIRVKSLRAKRVGRDWDITDYAVRRFKRPALGRPRRASSPSVASTPAATARPTTPPQSHPASQGAD